MVANAGKVATVIHLTQTQTKLCEQTMLLTVAFLSTCEMQQYRGLNNWNRVLGYIVL